MNLDIKPIDLNKYVEKHKQERFLLTKKSQAIYKYLDKTEESLEYYNYAIEYWTLTVNVHWNNIIEKILIDKLNYLNKLSNITYQVLFEKFITKLQLQQKILNYQIPFNDEEYISINRIKLKELDLKIASEQDQIKVIRYEIEYFNTQQAMGTSKISMSAQDIEKVHTKMLNDYNIYIDKLCKLMNLLQIKVETYTYYDPIEKVKDEIEIFKLKWEIEAKRDLANTHFKERGNIFKIIAKKFKSNKK